MKFHKRINKIIKELSLMYNIPVKDLEDIVYSQFELTKEVLESGSYSDPTTFKNVQLMHLGKFAAKPKRVEFIKNQIEIKKNGENQSNS